MGLLRHLRNWSGKIMRSNTNVRILPFDTMYYFNRGRNYSKLKEHEKAIDDFSRTLYYCSDDFKKKAAIYYLFGNEYTEINDYESAISNYSESIRLRPDLFRAFLMRGNAYLGLGDKDKAKADFDEYLRRKRP